MDNNTASPHDVEGGGKLRRWCADHKLATYIKARAAIRPMRLTRRRSDGSLWVASSPQDMGLAMRGLFSRKRDGGFFFIKTREWRGLLVASPKLFWEPSSGEFDVVPGECRVVMLKPWPYEVECQKILTRSLPTGGDDA